MPLCFRLLIRTYSFLMQCSLYQNSLVFARLLLQTLLALARLLVKLPTRFKSVTRTRPGVFHGAC